jgi:PPOX class probable F420-dependent enzyme
MPIDPDVHRLATATNYATVVTLMPDGQPQAQITWVDADDDHLLVNTEEGRQRTRNAHRDPRVTVLVRGENDPYDFVEVRGRVVEFVGGQEARDHIDFLSRKYDGQDYANPIGPGGRVILKIAPDKVYSHKRRRTPRSSEAS